MIFNIIAHHTHHPSSFQVLTILPPILVPVLPTRMRMHLTKSPLHLTSRRKIATWRLLATTVHPSLRGDHPLPRGTRDIEMKSDFVIPRSRIEHDYAEYLQLFREFQLHKRVRGRKFLFRRLTRWQRQRCEAETETETIKRENKFNKRLSRKKKREKWTWWEGGILKYGSHFWHYWQVREKLFNMQSSLFACLASFINIGGMDCSCDFQLEKDVKILSNILSLLLSWLEGLTKCLRFWRERKKKVSKQNSVSSHWLCVVSVRIRWERGRIAIN